MTVTEKTAYLKGLADGLKLSDSDEVLLIKKMIEVIDDLAVSVADLDSRCDELDEYIEEIDSDLGVIEDELYGDGDDADELYDDEDDYDSAEFEEYDEDEDEVFEVNCPSCDETICLPPSIDLAHVICPACGSEFSCICDCDDDGCDCGCDDCPRDKDENS